MSSSDTLVRAKPCRLCGQEIPPGTLLSALDWDREERAWAHRKPACAEVGQAAPVASPPPPTGLQDASARSEAAPHGSEPPKGLGSLPNDPPGGAWSVTIEIHEAADPAQSKRVLRIARLHLGTYAEARALADQLRREA